MKRPERRQIEWQPVALDQLLAVDHRARVVWRSVDSLHGETKMIENGTDPHARQKTDTDQMATDDAKQLDKQRPSIAECPNAECRNRGLQQFRVRGLKKAKATTLWYALTFNLMRLMAPGWAT